MYFGEIVELGNSKKVFSKPSLLHKSTLIKFTKYKRKKYKL